MTVFPAGRAVVDREQIRRDAEFHAAKHAYPEAHLGKTILALLAELEQAERERDEARIEGFQANESARRWELTFFEAEARLARVPALVEAVRRIVDDFPRTDMRGRGDYYAENLHQARDIARAALAEWEQA